MIINVLPDFSRTVVTHSPMLLGDLKKKRNGYCRGQNECVLYGHKYNMFNSSVKSFLRFGQVLSSYFLLNGQVLSYILIRYSESWWWGLLPHHEATQACVIPYQSNYDWLGDESQLFHKDIFENQNYELWGRRESIIPHRYFCAWVYVFINGFFFFNGQHSFKNYF